MFIVMTIKLQNNMSLYQLLVHTRQVNITFCMCWFASLEVTSKYYTPLLRQWGKITHKEFNFWSFFSILKGINLDFGIRVAYMYMYMNKNIHCNVNESIGYLPPCFIDKCTYTGVCLKMWCLYKNQLPQKRLFHPYHGQTHWRHGLHKDLNLNRKQILSQVYNSIDK